MATTYTLLETIKISISSWGEKMPPDPYLCTMPHMYALFSPFNGSSLHTCTCSNTLHTTYATQMCMYETLCVATCEGALKVVNEPAAGQNTRKRLLSWEVTH